MVRASRCLDQPYTLLHAVLGCWNCIIRSIDRKSTCNRRMNMLHVVMLLGFVLLQLDPAMSELTVNTVVLAGDSVVLNCTGTNINWRYYPPDHTGRDDGDKDIYMNGKLESEFEEKGFRIPENKTVGEVNLFITNVTDGKDGMAGKYECRNGSGSVVFYELIVLENIPVCNVTQVSDGCTVQRTDRLSQDDCYSEVISCSSSQNDSVRTTTDGITPFIGPNTCDIPRDQIRLSCSVTYFGNGSPILELRNLRENKLIESFCSETEVDANTGRKHLTCNVTMNATIDLDGEQFIWQTNQSAQTQYNCTTEPLKIQYSIDGETSNNKTVVHLGDKVNCTANCSHPCGYKWTWSEKPGQGGHKYVECTQEMVATRKGSYRCEAMCQMGKHRCEVTVMRVDVLPSTASEHDPIDGETSNNNTVQLGDNVNCTENCNHPFGFTVMRVDVLPPPASEHVGEQATVHWKIIVPIVAAIVIGVAAGSAVLYILLRRRRRNQTQNQIPME